MSEETAQAARRLRAEGSRRRQDRAHHLLRRRDADELQGAARAPSPTPARRAAELGKLVDFSLTTNATLLQPDVIDFLADERIGVTISIDGPQEIQDKFRVFSNGKGSYDIVAPKIKALLARHRTRPIGARVTLTEQTLDVQRIYKPPDRRDGVLGSRLRAGDHGAAARPRHRRRRLRRPAGAVPGAGPGVPARRRCRTSTTASPTCARRCRRSTRASKAYPCGAGLGLMGVATDGDVSLCHRFAGSDAHQLRLGDRRHRSGASRRRSSRSTTSRTRPTAASCWARPICARRLLPRGAHALRRHHAAEPALLRVDSRLDRHLPARSTASSP